MPKLKAANEVAATQKGDYAVGYGRPPKASQFKPGQSGNSKGRPKNETTVQGAIEKELRRTREIRVDGKLRRHTHAEVIAMQMIKQAMEGKSQSIAQIVKMASATAAVFPSEAALTQTVDSDASVEQPLTETDFAMMQWYVNARSNTDRSSEGEGLGDSAERGRDQ